MKVAATISRGSVNVPQLLGKHQKQTGIEPLKIVSENPKNSDESQ